MPLPASSTMRLPSSLRTSTHEVLPPYRFRVGGRRWRASRGCPDLLILHGSSWGQKIAMAPSGRPCWPRSGKDVTSIGRRTPSRPVICRVGGRRDWSGRALTEGDGARGQPTSISPARSKRRDPLGDTISPTSSKLRPRSGSAGSLYTSLARLIDEEDRHAEIARCLPQQNELDRKLLRAWRRLRHQAPPWLMRSAGSLITCPGPCDRGILKRPRAVTPSLSLTRDLSGPCASTSC